MYPHDIEQQSLEMPSGDRHSAVLVTGECLRHLQFGYQLQNRFPGMVKKWFFFGGVSKPSEPRLKRALEKLKRVRIREGVRVAPLGYDKIKSRLRDRRSKRTLKKAEVRIFGGQVQNLSYQVKFKARGLSMRVTSGPDTGWLLPLKRLNGRIVQAVLRLGRH